MTPGRKLMLLVERMSGVVLPDRELQRLTAWAAERAAICRLKDANAYVDALKRNPESDEWRILLSRVTAKESSLFRAPQHFRCLQDDLIPQLLASGRRSIKVWSAGCARGEEPTTLAIVLSECLSGTGVSWSIVGTDVDADALVRARRGRFPERSVRRVPAEILEKHFTPIAGGFQLKSEAGSHIHYASLNLVQEPLEVPEQPFDIIFLRNVLIYFRRESQVRVVRRIGEILAPDGFLFVGPSESLMHVATEMKAEKRCGVFVYSRRDRKENPRAARPSDKPIRRPERSNGGVNACAGVNQVRGELDSKDPESFAVEGREAEAKGDLRTALRCYRAALYLEPNLFQVRFCLGICLDAVGWTGRADAEFRTVTEMLRLGSGLGIQIPEGPVFPTRREIEEALKRAR